MSKSRDPTKLMSFITQLVNIIKDLVNLAETHNIENNLYFGDGLHNIYGLMGDARSTRWFSSIREFNLTEKQKWKQLIDFLEKEAKVQQQRALPAHLRSHPRSINQDQEEVTTTIFLLKYTFNFNLLSQHVISAKENVKNLTCQPEDQAVPWSFSISPAKILPTNHLLNVYQHFGRKDSVINVSCQGQNVKIQNTSMVNANGTLPANIRRINNSLSNTTYSFVKTTRG